MCNCNRNIHWVTDIQNNGTTVVLNVTNSTNIGNLQPFTLLICRCMSANIAAAPQPVMIMVNATVIPLLDQNGEVILSNKIPRCSHGKYISTTATSAADGQTKVVNPPYVILYDTPKRRINA